MSRKYKLLIYIPTYNREVALKNQLVSLREQLTPDVCVFVSDNNSSFNLEPLLLEFKQENITFNKNNKNLGIAGNITQAFLVEIEYEFLWILGDDDFILPGVLSEILSELKEYDLIIFPASATVGSQKLSKDLSIKSLDTFFEYANVFTFLGFISINIYNRRIVDFSIQPAFLFSYTFFPHVAVVLNYFNNHKTTAIKVLKGRTWLTPTDFGGAKSWSNSQVQVLERFLILTELLNSTKLKEKYAHNFLSSWGRSLLLQVGVGRFWLAVKGGLKRVGIRTYLLCGYLIFWHYVDRCLLFFWNYIKRFYLFRFLRKLVKNSFRRRKSR